MSQLIDQVKGKEVDIKPIIEAILEGEKKFELLDKVITDWPIDTNIDFSVPKDNYQQLSQAIQLLGKMRSFQQYENHTIEKTLILQLQDSIKFMNSEQIANVAIGLALLHFKEESIWQLVVDRSLQMESQEFHHLMRIATGVSLMNYNSPEFFQSFKNRLFCELSNLTQDVFTQCLMVLSQQNIQILPEEEQALEKHINTNAISVLNKQSIYCSFARLNIGSEQFYNQLTHDLYEFEIKDCDQIGHFVLELLKVKNRIPQQILNVIVAKAYSDCGNQDLIKKISALIKN